MGNGLGMGPTQLPVQWMLGALEDYSPLSFIQAEGMQSYQTDASCLR